MNRIFRYALVATIVCASFAVMSCSAYSTQGPPPGHEHMTWFQCTDDLTSPATEALMALSLLSAPPAAVLYGADAYIGFKRVQACKRAKASRAAALQLLRRTPEGQRPDVTLARVVVTMPSDTLHVGDTSQLQAAALTSSGAAIAGRLFDWSSSNDAVASPDAAGRVSAKATGSATIAAKSGGIQGSATLIVVP